MRPIPSQTQDTDFTGFAESKEEATRAAFCGFVGLDDLLTGLGSAIVQGTEKGQGLLRQECERLKSSVLKPLQRTVSKSGCSLISGVQIGLGPYVNMLVACA